MAELHNTETSQEIEKTIEDIINKIINDIEYEVMDTTLKIFDKFEEEPTIGDLEGLLFYAKLFEGDCSSTIIQLDDESSTRPVEL